MATYKNFRSLVKLKTPDRDNGTETELVLKFFAYLNWQKKIQRSSSRVSKRLHRESAE